MAADERRITELEIKLSFCEDLLETLNATVVRQQGEIDRLQAQLRVLREQMTAAAGPGEPRSLRDELPPHW